MEKEHEYAFKILSAIQTCFDEDSDHYIDKSDLMEDKNLTHFMHALFNIAPNLVYDKFTGEGDDILATNHIANRLIVQYSRKDIK